MPTLVQNERLHCHRKLCLHGLSLDVSCQVPSLLREFDRVTAPFIVSELPAGFATLGSVRPYIQSEVLRHLSSSASRLPQSDPWLEVYHDEDRFWIVDERWGLAEINLLRGQWRSWVLDGARANPLQQIEGAMLWPMAQLLRSRGLHLVPAASVARDGWGALILSGFAIGGELELAMRQGYRVVGQRWTAARMQDGRIELLHVPGVVEPETPPRLRGLGAGEMTSWIDPVTEIRGCSQSHAFCNAVVIIEPGRRSDPRIRELTVNDAREMLRRRWPIAEIHPSRRAGQLSSQLAQLCRCASAQLSRLSGDLPVILESLRETAGIHTMA